MSKTISTQSQPLTKSLVKRIIPIAEWLLLAVGVAIALAPIYSVSWYQTGDGPFHLYSATVLNDILFHSGESFGRFYDLHITPVPNTSVLVFQSLMLELFNPNTVLMLTILVISGGLILGYFYFIKSINPDQKGISVLILPMAISFFTIIGFFSFLASLALMLVTLGYFNKRAHNLNKKHIAVLAAFITLNWFTHFTGALFSLGYIALYILLINKEEKTSMIKMFLLICIPFVSLSLVFGKEASKSSAVDFTPFSNLFKALLDFSPLVCYHSDEINYIRHFQYLLLLLFPISIFYFRKRELKPTLFAPLIFSLLLVTIFFIVPSNFLNLKSINFRILFCALLFFCAFIEAYSPRYYLVLTIPVVIFVLLKKKNFQTPIVEAYSERIESIVKNTEALPKGKAVIAMNYSDNWLEYNICLYPAATHRIVILDNEEAATFNSIIRWKKNKQPGPNIGNVFTSNNPILKLNYEKDADEKIEGVVQWQYNIPGIDSVAIHNDSIFTNLFIDKGKKNGVQVYIRK
ncbi:MAG: hypothetical protein WAQ28_06650 [Bacteroidia bacterium]